MDKIEQELIELVIKMHSLEQQMQQTLNNNNIDINNIDINDYINNTQQTSMMQATTGQRRVGTLSVLSDDSFMSALDQWPVSPGAPFIFIRSLFVCSNFFLLSFVLFSRLTSLIKCNVGGI